MHPDTNANLCPMHTFLNRCIALLTFMPMHRCESVNLTIPSGQPLCCCAWGAIKGSGPSPRAPQSFTGIQPATFGLPVGHDCSYTNVTSCCICLSFSPWKTGIRRASARRLVPSEFTEKTSFSDNVLSLMCRKETWLRDSAGHIWSRSSDEERFKHLCLKHRRYRRPVLHLSINSIWLYLLQ